MLWDGSLYPHDANTIFHDTRAENTTFAFRSRERKWYFRPGYGENKFLITIVYYAPTRKKIPYEKLVEYLLKILVLMKSGTNLYSIKFYNIL